MNESDGTTSLNTAVSNTTGSLPDSVVFFVDSGSTSDSALSCGDRLSPCASIEDGWKIAVDLGISSLSMSILHNTTQKEQVRIMFHHDIVIESGTSSNQELHVSPSSSSEIEDEGMVEVSEGQCRIRQVDVVLSDSPSLIFIRLFGGHLIVEACSVTSTSSTLSNSADVLCSWSGGSIVLDHATTTITSSTFSGLSFGAINMDGGSLTIDSSSFDSNNPLLSNFPSFRRNIRCTGLGMLTIESLSGGDGIETQSAWISESDCSLTAQEEISRSPFFVPTLSSSSTSQLNETAKMFHLTIEGTTLIPCSLFLEVFEKKNDGTESLPKQFPLTQESTVEFNETTITLSIPLSSLSSFDNSLEWRVYLRFGKDQLTSTTFIIQQDVSERRKKGMMENMMWWIPVVISVSVLLGIVLVVVVICCRRRSALKFAQKVAETDESEQPSLDEVKMEIKPFSSAESKEDEGSDDVIDLKGYITIAEDETNMKTDTHSTHQVDDTVSVMIEDIEGRKDGMDEEMMRETRGDEKDEKEERDEVMKGDVFRDGRGESEEMREEEMMERPHKKKRKKKAAVEAGGKEETAVTTQPTEEPVGVEALDDGNGGGKKKRKKKKKDPQQANDQLLAFEGQNEDIVIETETSRTREEEDAEVDVKKKTKKKKKKTQLEDVVEEEDNDTLHISRIVDEVERPKRTKKEKKKKVEMREKDENEEEG
ncbi:hypothetical protein BLNAU_5314 [Blattamonas nauphoetae]|uniref:Uncharacterized protein n=1 Tax=Blattamonas nauphoetae TaxID=2049346 RepID=A0ABQ9Y7Z7_9EUKA|nr:hypothetical protein BLNAU_5314 [Blattamonas nauphoetae]